MRLRFFVTLTAGAGLGWAGPAAAQIAVTGTTVYTQTFDTLPSSGSATFSQFDSGTPTLPGVFAVRSGNGTTIVAGDGSSNAGNLYSFGTGTGTDRALGTIGSGNAAAGRFGYGLVFQNTDTQVLNINVQYAGEQWRNSAAAAQTVSFSYTTQSAAPTAATLAALIPSTNNTDPTGYTAVDALDFISPITGGTAGALDGNAAANRATFNVNVAVNLASNDYLILYWVDPDHTGNDHGLGIDDLRVAFTPVPEPATVLGIAAAGLGAVRLARRRLRGRGVTAAADTAEPIGAEIA
ncbi:MAG: PEP-CTERM sorting domain-containing protein [Gemmataceae bacterium]